MAAKVESRCLLQGPQEIPILWSHILTIAMVSDAPNRHQQGGSVALKTDPGSATASRHSSWYEALCRGGEL